jgi:hypothetical protein
MPLVIQTAAAAAAGLVETFTPQEIFAAMLAQRATLARSQSIAQFPAVPSDGSTALGGPWLLTFAAYCDGEEESSDYATAAAIVRDVITEIAAQGVSVNRCVALIRGLGLLYRRVMKATPHLRNQA